MLVYKVLLPAEWAEFEANGYFKGSPFDLSSGYIHCSSREQVSGVALRIFGAEPALVVLALDVQMLGEWLRWEVGYNGGPYPHVYAPLPLSAVAAVHRIAGASSVDEVLPR